MLAAGLRAADPGPLVRAALRASGRRLIAAGHSLPLGRGRVLVVGAGKASGAMAAAAEAALGARIADGLVVVKDGYPRAHPPHPLVEAGHPVPDARGEAAARGGGERSAEACGADDLLLVLVSGGGSALPPAPVPPSRSRTSRP